MRRSLLAAALALVAAALFAAPLTAAADALDEVNAARAAAGKPAFVRDEGLTQAAMRCADMRAANLIAGHLPSDFAYLPPGSTADAAGCGALAPHWGWGSCCTYENWKFAGAAVTMGADGKRYMHLFVSNRPGVGAVAFAAGPEPAPKAEVKGAPKTSYADVYAKVAKGETVTIKIGPGGLECVELKGFAPGTYKCWKDAAGAHQMQPCPCGVGCACPAGVCPSCPAQAVVPRAYAIPYGFPGSSCPNGQCPTGRR